jgi:hypothetical protein
MNEAMYQTWKRAKLQEDKGIMEQLNEMVKPYDYTIESGFGFYIRKAQKAHYEQKYAEVAWNGWEFAISTVSSHWDVSEATTFMKQLRESTEIVAELNTFIKKLDYAWKKEFEKEMKQLREEAEAKKQEEKDGEGE